MLRVKLFAGIRQKIGKDEIMINTEHEIKVEELISIIKENYPEIGEMNFFVSVNHEFADKEKIIKDGDEIALLPPVSGG